VSGWLSDGRMQLAPCRTNLIGRTDGIGQRVRGVEGIDLQGTLLVLDQELVAHVPLGKDGIGRFGLEEVSKAFVEPQVSPPGTRDEISGPLVRKLVRHDRRNALAIGSGIDALIQEQRRLAVGDQAYVMWEVGDDASDVGVALVVRCEPERDTHPSSPSLQQQNREWQSYRAWEVGTR